MPRYSLLISALVVLLTACTPNGSYDDAEKFLEAHGWSIAGSVKESTVEIPSDLSPVSGTPPWAVLLEQSKSVGLDFSDQAGKTVKILAYPVIDQEGRLEGDYHWAAALLVNQDGRIIGAWVTPIGTLGGSYSIEGKTLEEVTGLTWPAYWEMHSQE